MTTRTLICCAYPFGYGPAAKLLHMVPRLRTLGVRLVFLGTGISHELASKNGVFDDVVCATPNDPRVVPLLGSSAGMLSLMDRDYSEVAQGLGVPVFVVDSLTWLRDEIPAVFRRAKRYWAQEFIGVRERLAEVGPHARVVGPIVARAAAARTRGDGPVVVNLGGGESPTRTVEDDPAYADFIFRTLLGDGSPLKDARGALLIAGEGTIRYLRGRGTHGDIELRSAPHDEALRLMADARCVLTAPGLTATLECFQMGVETHFLPPQNYSQWWILKGLRELGLAPGSLHWADHWPDCPVVERMGETERGPLVSQAIRHIGGDATVQQMFRESTKTMFEANDGALASRQREFFDSLGPDGIERVVNDLRHDMIDAEPMASQPDFAFSTPRSFSGDRALQSNNNTASGLDVQAISAALGTASHTPYAPPHVFPMSAPKFENQPEASRKRAQGDRMGLYIHVPFCNYSCSFCFYARRIGDDRALMERYVKSLKRELEWVEPGTKLTQLYVGGGTPTALPADLLDDVLTTAWQRVRPDGDAVHTVECSPESVTPEHLAVLDKNSIGRVSMGIQSLDEHVLQVVNRQHSGNAALESCDRLVASGRVVNVDLIYGLPSQSEDVFRNDFRTMVAHGVDSITAYNLRVNERTPVVRDIKLEEKLDLDRLLRWRQFVRQTALEAGFVPKTGHTFERPTAKARTFEDQTAHGEQFGAGPSARSRLDFTIYRNHANLPTYLDRMENDRSPVEEVFPLTLEGRKTRFIALTLGVSKPLSRSAYAETFGCSFDDEFSEPLNRMGEAGLVEDLGATVELSETGKLLYDLATLAFYPKPVQNWLGERHAAALTKRAPRAAAVS